MSDSVFSELVTARASDLFFKASVFTFQFNNDDNFRIHILGGYLYPVNPTFCLFLFPFTECFFPVTLHKVKLKCSFSKTVSA